jgi:hypothetical protein
MSSTTSTEYHETSWDQYQEYRQTNCYICEYFTYAAYMEEREDGHFYCENCAFIPPYSHTLYNAIVGLQRLFRAYFEKKAKPCGSCDYLTIHLSPSLLVGKAPVCKYCADEELYEMRREYEDDHEECSDCGYQVCHCHDHEDEGPCEDCGNPYECVCLEQVEDARLARHRRVCGDKECDGSCGTLDCGCIDVCRGRCGLRSWD